MTDIEILTMPIPLAEGPRLDAWLAAFRAFDVDPAVISTHADAYVPTLTLHLDGTVTLTCDVTTSSHDPDLDGIHTRLEVTRPATIVALALDAVA